MKKYRFPAIIRILVLSILLVPVIAVAQNKDSMQAVDIKNMVASQHYTFKAQTASPLSGRLRQLTSDYDLQVSKEKIVAYLPYFGRSYSAPIDPSKGGIQFTSKDFDYRLTERKKGGWNVSIKTKDISEAQDMQLTIFSDGTASLQVNSANRQSISFQGYLTDKKK
jgi:hypothetical protein